jgi:hypothetical protein
MERLQRFESLDPDHVLSVGTLHSPTGYVIVASRDQLDGKEQLVGQAVLVQKDYVTGLAAIHYLIVLQGELISNLADGFGDNSNPVI